MKKTLLLVAVLGAGLPTVALHADDDSKFKDLTTAEALEDDSARKAVLHTIETLLGGLDYESGFPTTPTRSSSIEDDATMALIQL